jgi:hypothetical protein
MIRELHLLKHFSHKYLKQVCRFLLNENACSLVEVEMDPDSADLKLRIRIWTSTKKPS